LEAGSKPHKVRVISETGWEEGFGVLKTRDEVELVMEEETLRSPPSGGRKKNGPDFQCSTSSWTFIWDMILICWRIRDI
jgi:hypothetical protein